VGVGEGEKINIVAFHSSLFLPSVKIRKKLKKGERREINVHYNKKLNSDTFCITNQNH
jgi:hypothetical protein